MINSVTFFTSHSAKGIILLYSNIEFHTTHRAHFANPAFYEDHDSELPPGVTIQSDIIDSNVLRLFIEHQYRYELFFKDSCQLGQQSDTIKNIDRRVEGIKNCLKKLYLVYVDDSLVTDLDFIFYKNERYNQKGFLNWIDIGYLPIGKHEVRLEIRNLAGIRLRRFIPFYKSSPKIKPQ